MLFVATRQVKHTDKTYPIGHTIPEFSSWPSFVQTRLMNAKPPYVTRIADADDPGEGTGIPHEPPPELSEEEKEAYAQRKADHDEAVLSAQAAVRIQGVDTQAAAQAKGLSAPVPCDQCEATFKNKTGLSNHKRSAHPDDDE